jgi:hemolysin activation/secretion protein
MPEIRIEPTKYFQPSYFADRLRRGMVSDGGGPFNLRQLEDTQAILLQQPYVNHLNLDLQPGPTPGTARLDARVDEATTDMFGWSGPPAHLSFAIADDQSPVVGGVRGQVAATIGNLLGVGDTLALEYGRSADLNDGMVNYVVPVSSDGTLFDIGFGVNDSAVVTSSLQALNIASTYEDASIGFRHPFYFDPVDKLSLGVHMEWLESRSYLLGEPFSFVAGADEGRTNVTVLRFDQEFSRQDEKQDLYVGSTERLGLDILGATDSGGPASGRFLLWQGHARYGFWLFKGDADLPDDSGNWKGTELWLRTSMQLSTSALFPIEQFAMGGIDIVRGYREYLTTSDNGIAGSIELRVPVGQVEVPMPGNAVAAGPLQLVPFFDRGYGWNTGRAASPYNNLASVGLGLRWPLDNGVTAEIYYGYALYPVHVGNSIEDKGISFRIAVSVF